MEKIDPGKFEEDDVQPIRKRHQSIVVGEEQRLKPCAMKEKRLSFNPHHESGVPSLTMQKFNSVKEIVLEKYREKTRKSMRKIMIKKECLRSQI